MSALALFPAQPLAGEPDSLGKLHRQLDDLHQMIYRRGGIRPVNAAIEELTKLLLLELAVCEEPRSAVPGWGPLYQVVDPDKIISEGDVEAVKAAFRHVASLPKYAARLPDGGTQPIWPSDEPPPTRSSGRDRRGVPDSPRPAPLGPCGCV